MAEDSIYGNDMADTCAETGQIVSTLRWVETPTDVNDFNWSQAHHYNSCSERIFLWDRVGMGIS